MVLACFYVQAMWFPMFDSIHSKQKKYNKSTNTQLTNSKGLTYVTSCIEPMIFV